MSKFRDSIAALFRVLPKFRGKSHLGVWIGHLMIDSMKEEDCITTIKLRDDSLIRLDVRSRTERWAYWTGEYDNDVISKFSACLQPDWVVFDVGANVGFYTIPLGKKLLTLNGTIHAFEPVPANFERLSDSIKLNALERVARLHKIALGDEEGMVSMWVEQTNNSSTGNAGIIKGSMPDNPQDLQASAYVKKLDDFAKDNKINACHFIKIDVEGAELMFLRGGMTFISKHRPIIYGEFNSYFMNRFGHSFLDVVDIIAHLNYRFFQEIKHGEFIEFTEPKMGIQNVLLVPQNLSKSVASSLGINI